MYDQLNFIIFRIMQNNWWCYSFLIRDSTMPHKRTAFQLRQNILSTLYYFFFVPACSLPFFFDKLHKMVVPLLVRVLAKLYIPSTLNTDFIFRQGLFFHFSKFCGWKYILNWIELKIQGWISYLFKISGSTWCTVMCKIV